MIRAKIPTQHSQAWPCHKSQTGAQCADRKRKEYLGEHYRTPETENRLRLPSTHLPFPAGTSYFLELHSYRTQQARASQKSAVWPEASAYVTSSQGPAGWGPVTVYTLTTARGARRLFPQLPTRQLLPAFSLPGRQTGLGGSRQLGSLCK